MKLVLPVLLIFLLILITGCEDESTDPGSGDPPANEIWIEGNSFRPSSKTIVAGTTITWVNKDNVSHTATSGSGSPTGVFDSGNLGNGQSFSYTFDSTNTYGYYCKLHPNMRGTIIVQ
jgi:plastocyanin